MTDGMLSPVHPHSLPVSKVLQFPLTRNLLQVFFYLLSPLNQSELLVDTHRPTSHELGALDPRGDGHTATSPAADRSHRTRLVIAFWIWGINFSPWQISCVKNIRAVQSMDRKDVQSARGQVTHILLDFLEVAITSIVFHKGIYPSGAFERRRYMNLVVHRAKHPQLHDYIHSAVAGLFSFVDKGLVDRVAVIFFDSDGTPLEKYTFKVQVNQAYGSKVHETDLVFSLRSFLVKLSVLKAVSSVLPKDCRWEITAYFRALPQASTSKGSELWIPTDTKQWQQPPLITPVKSMNSEPLGLQLYLEHPSLSDPKGQSEAVHVP